MRKLERVNFTLPGLEQMKCDFYELAKSNAATANAMPGDLKGLDCPKCLNRGFSLRAREDGTLVSVVCDCMPGRKSVRKMELSGLDSVIREKRLKNFRAEEPWQQELLRKATDYAADPKGWLLMCGQPGSGKTHLCTAVCRELLLRGMQVCYMSWRDEMSGLKYGRGESDLRNARMQELKTAQVLYVDDLFKTGGADPTPAELAIAFELFNFRYQNHRTTIVSTERTPQELVQLDEAIGSRIVEAAADHTCVIKRDMKRNYRLRSVLS